LAASDFLTETRIRSARPKARPHKLRDGGGLYLLVTPANARLWRLRYKVRERESMLGLGTYPATSLKAARDRDRASRAGSNGRPAGALTPIKVTNRAAITEPREVAQLLRAIDGSGKNHFVKRKRRS
jgi:Arm DNA-binding domain